MTQKFELLITAEVPSGSGELGHEAVVESRDYADDVIDKLHSLGLVNGSAVRRLVARKGPQGPRKPKATA